MMAVWFESSQERNAICTGSDDERVQNELGQVEFEETIVSKWTKNMELRQFLQNCVYERRRKTDILKLVKERFPFYCWSLTNLTRRMKIFELESVNNKIPLEKIAQAIQIERQLISCSSTSSSTSTGRPNLGYRRLVKILRERYKLPVSRPAVQRVLKCLRSSDQASVGNIEHCREKLVHETGSDTMEMRDIDDIPSEVTMATDSVFTIARESEQITGSFKLRGAFNKLLSLKESNDEVFLTQGAITASTGNHGAAAAYASHAVGVPVTIYIPQATSPAKLKVIKQFGGSLKFHGEDCVEAEMKARAVAEESKLHFVSPYNDLIVAAGQGTIGVEIFQDLPEVNAVFVAVGGGGLIGGIAAYLKSVKQSIKMIGCQPSQSAVMAESVKAGKILDLPSGDTLSDGTAGGIEEISVTFDLCKSFVDEWILVTEEEISKAVYQFMENHHKIVEGAAGVAIAAYLKEQERFRGENVVIISCGANISMKKLKDIILQWG